MDNTCKHSCEPCGYSTILIGNYKNHMKSKKHVNIITNNVSLHDCLVCNKKFMTNSGLWKHSRRCTPEEKPIITTRAELRSELSTVLTELKEVLVLPITNSNTQNNNTNTQNNTNNSNNSNNTQNNNININMFLNENCAEAINFIDVMKSIQIGRDYRAKVIANGFVKTICGMITQKFDEIPIMKRPIHYITDEDENQQIIHIRDNNEWRKETELEWTSQIHDYYSGELSDNTPEHEKNKIFFGLKQLEDNIMAQLTEYYSRSIQFKVFERESQSEMNYVPHKLKIIKHILDSIKIDNSELFSLITPS